jgi:hypothetical protein
MDKQVQTILGLLESCTIEQRKVIFQELRREFKIHPIEGQLNIVAEIILEAIHKDQTGLTFRMMRGVIAEAAFEVEVISKMKHWKMDSLEGDPPFDYLLSDGEGKISVQVKLQRSVKHEPMLANKANKNFSPDMFVVETQKTRGGIDSTTKENTRPYRFGEFDIIAVSMQPSTGQWGEFMYTVSDWLIPDPKDNSLILKFQPIPKSSNEDWTNDFETCIKWLREKREKTIDH